MKVTELKPCPFCGDTPKFKSWMDENIWDHNIVKWVGIECSCGVEVPAWPEEVVEEEVISVWNARV